MGGLKNRERKERKRMIVALRVVLALKINCPNNNSPPRTFSSSSLSVFFCYHCIKCIATIFLATFMWRGPLNSAVSTTTIHGEPKKMADGTYTQVGAQMMNKCMIRIAKK